VKNLDIEMGSGQGGQGHSEFMKGWGPKSSSSEPLPKKSG
jgi:hypothetical protein